MKSNSQSSHFWLITLAAVIVAGGTFSLGHWQLSRAAQKETLQAVLDSRNALKAIDTQQLADIKNIEAEIYRPVSVEGVWDATHTVYLDNRPMNGETGFWVVTPLLLQGSQKMILVQRGWVPRNFINRVQLPDVQTPAGIVTIKGRLAQSPSKLYEFKGSDTGRIRQNIDIDAFRLETGLPLMSASLQQTGPQSDGLLREWSAPNLGVDRHYGYAIQWFSMFGLVLGLYAWFQLFIPIRMWVRRQR